MLRSVDNIDSHNRVTKPISMAKIVPCANYDWCHIIRVIKPRLAGIPCTKPECNKYCYGHYHDGFMAVTKMAIPGSIGSPSEIAVFNILFLPWGSERWSTYLSIEVSLLEERDLCDRSSSIENTRFCAWCLSPFFPSPRNVGWRRRFQSRGKLLGVLMKMQVLLLSWWRIGRGDHSLQHPYPCWGLTSASSLHTVLELWQCNLNEDQEWHQTMGLLLIVMCHHLSATFVGVVCHCHLSLSYVIVLY